VFGAGAGAGAGADVVAPWQPASTNAAATSGAKDECVRME
jgi:hypothetical protein